MRPIRALKRRLGPTRVLKDACHAKRVCGAELLPNTEIGHYMGMPLAI